MQSTPENRSSFYLVMQWAAEAILQRQREDGALLMAPADQLVNSIIPYFANLAVIGLTVAYPHTRNGLHVRAAQRWLRWYATHLNADGTIYDYRVRSGATQPTGDYDSTDSYAATFLEALQRTAQVGGSRQWLVSLYPAARKAAGAIRLTLQPDGLTWAKPSYRVKYLMDNVEVFRGWQSAQWIARTMRRKREAEEFQKLAGHTLQAIEAQLFLQEEGYYAWALHEDGARETRLSEWYPDIMAQLMAIAWLPASARRKTLFARLHQQFRRVWQSALEENQVSTLVWWSMAAIGAGDHDFARRLMRPLMEEGVRGRAQLHLGEYGHVLRVCAELPRL
ncbi:MAG: hypothetical protein NZ520_11215 [bacterium]|nr:hypothetical protein [bacterium]